MPVTDAPPKRRTFEPSFTSKDVAARLSVPVTTVWGWIRAGWLEAEELPRGIYRIRPEALDRFLAEKPWRD